MLRACARKCTGVCLSVCLCLLVCCEQCALVARPIDREHILSKENAFCVQERGRRRLNAGRREMRGGKESYGQREAGGGGGGASERARERENQRESARERERESEREKVLCVSVGCCLYVCASVLFELFVSASALLRYCMCKR